MPAPNFDQCSPFWYSVHSLISLKSNFVIIELSLTITARWNLKRSTDKTRSTLRPLNQGLRQSIGFFFFFFLLSHLSIILSSIDMHLVWASRVVLHIIDMSVLIGQHSQFSPPKILTEKVQSKFWKPFLGRPYVTWRFQPHSYHIKFD